MMRVTALTGSANQPSSRFRVRQHIPRLRQLGVDVTDLPARIDRHAQILPPSWERMRMVRWPTRALMHGLKAASRIPDVAAARDSSVTWIQRELIPGVPTWEPWLPRPRVLDVDDAIWLSPPAGKTMAKVLAKTADLVVAGNKYIAEWFSAFASRVEIIPTAVDTEHYRPKQKGNSERGGLNIGWIGTSANLKYVHGIARSLSLVLKSFDETRLTIVSNARPSLPDLPEGRVFFRAWSPEDEVPAIQDFDIGLMPLADDAWTRGKCAFKMLQYMACGVPVIASPVGMNRDVLALGEVGLPSTEESRSWTESLVHLVENPDLRYAMGREGRQVVETHFSSHQISAKLAAVFQEVAGRSAFPG